MIHAINKLDDPNLLTQMRKNARKEAENFSWEKAFQQLLDYYTKTIEIHREKTLAAI